MVSTLKLKYIFSLPLDLNSQRIILHMKIFFLVIYFSIHVLFYLLGPPPKKKKKKKKKIIASSLTHITENLFTSRNLTHHRQ